MLLERFIDRLFGARADGDGGEQGRRVDDLLYRQSLFDSAEQFADALLAALASGPPPPPSVLARVGAALRGAHVGGAGFDQDAAEAAVRFWRELAGRFPDDAYVAACHADALLAAGDPLAAMARFLDAFEREPGLFDEFDGDLEPLARRAGGLTWLRHRLAALRALLDGDLDDRADDVREAYSELLDEHADDPAALERIRPLGRRIEELEAAGRLPRAFIRRGSSRRR
jgi:hypothetical protein